MKTLNYNKQEVIGKLRENLAKHRNEYDEALKAWRALANEHLLKVSEELIAVAARAKAETEAPIGSFNPDIPYKAAALDLRFSFQNPKPESHESDYERAINRLNMSSDDFVELDEDEFRQYIEDDWDWSEVEFEKLSNYSTTLSARRR